VGTHKMITITVGEEAALPITKEVTFTVIPELAYFQTLVAGISTELGGRIRTVETTLTTLSTTIQSLTAALNDARNTINALMGLSAVSLIIAIVAVVLALRKK